MTGNKTIDYYNHQAEAYIRNTYDADVEEIRSRFLKYQNPGNLILDFGCGSGRDSKAFLEQGYRVFACDGSEEMCRLASQHTGLQVRQMLFGDLKEERAFDGIWACASVLHLPKAELLSVFKRMQCALKDNGFAYVSFKYGEFEGERNGRYFTDLTENSFQDILQQAAGFDLTEMWISSDVRKDRSGEKWLNAVLRKKQK